MGLFGNVINNAKERVNRETQPLLERVFDESYDISSLTDDTYETLRRGVSIASRVKIIQAYRWRLHKEFTKEYVEDDKMVRIFNRLYEDRRNDVAANMAQWIGKELYDKGISAVDAKEVGDGKYMYIPRDY